MRREVVSNAQPPQSKEESAICDTLLAQVRVLHEATLVLMKNHTGSWNPNEAGLLCCALDDIFDWEDSASLRGMCSL